MAEPGVLALREGERRRLTERRPRDRVFRYPYDLRLIIHLRLLRNGYMF